MARWRPWTRDLWITTPAPQTTGPYCLLVLAWGYERNLFINAPWRHSLTYRLNLEDVWPSTWGQEDCNRFVWSVTAPVWQTTLLCRQGRQFPDANLPGVPPEQTKAIFEASIRTLVQLQSVETDKVDLDGIGDKENFFHLKVSTHHTRLRAISRRLHLG